MPSVAALSPSLAGKLLAARTLKQSLVKVAIETGLGKLPLLIAVLLPSLEMGLGLSSGASLPP